MQHTNEEDRSARPPTDDSRADRWAIGVALATITAWYVVVTLCLPHTLGDEMYHVPAIRDLADGQPLGRELPMPPTYHWIASWPARLVGDELCMIRAFQALVGVATVFVFRAAARRLHPAGDARRLLLLAWRPLVLPFFVLAYTDVASLLALLAAVYFHVRARHLFGAAALLLACLIRQSNLLWVVFFAAWRTYEAWGSLSATEGADGGQGAVKKTPLPVREGAGGESSATTQPPHPTSPPRGRGVLGGGATRWLYVAKGERLWLHALVLVVGAGFLLTRGRVVMAPFFENRPAFNPAQF